MGKIYRKKAFFNSVKLLTGDRDFFKLLARPVDYISADTGALTTEE